MGAEDALLVILMIGGAMLYFGAQNISSELPDEGNGIPPSTPGSPSSKRNQTTTSARNVPNLARGGGNQTTSGARNVPNLARGGGNQTTKKPTLLPGRTTTTTSPRYVANKILRPRCITKPFFDGNYWVCDTPTKRGIKQGREWSCNGLKARYQNLGHICYPQSSFGGLDSGFIDIAYD